MRTKLLAVLAAAALAAACAHSVDTAGVETFGQAVENNGQHQIIPAATDTRAPEGSGAQGALAQSRYRTGTTEPLLPSSSSIANPSSTD